MEPKDLKPGEGGVMNVKGDDLAVFNDNGTLHAASAICTHKGCIIGWNDAEKTFDCPCHGSRFNHDFTVKNGPADRPLDAREIS